ncbi:MULTISPECIES: LacI family DNA-binding transcriptional regulator [Ramlibacter]|uniref:LacI family DNA-binding transcriptional regulator n=1 Tax=Ramlibacter pinisoli TaxID=2682844 RepID=A0A6N8IZF2_9BURK|nr:MULTISPECIES: LacI family DNA-binding transcriptional regulator [Ramlibacter]MBA2961372.1 LacI family DNA-binding transcriptional regulator [Ramlibacter sp. CGMCC 1.13660]MVQ31316.1 LacI family DNA-binding transcriptional regulator [Ramlibacter pinisoli]
MKKTPPAPAAAPRPRPRARAEGGVTLQDVARLAGVSPMSASRALNTPARVSQDILQRVQEAVARTGYVRNSLAGALASRRSRLVAALVPNVAGPVFQDLIQALIAALGSAGYQLILAQSGYGVLPDDLLNAVLGQRPDGLVLAGVVPSAQGRQRLQSAGLPVVETWDMVAEPVDMLVGFSHEQIAGAVATHLIADGRRQLAFVGGEHARAQRRARSFVSAALDKRRTARGHADAVAVESVPAPADVRSGRDALARILARQPKTDAVFCSSDLLALGVVTEAQARGIRIPEQLAVVGFGDLSFAADVLPALTTVRIDSAAIGATAARFIVERAEGRPVAATTVDVGFSIVTRDTA